MACAPPMVASRLVFDCSPVRMLFGLPVNGRRVRFDETAFYEFLGAKIVSVRSVIDTAGVAAQLPRADD
ncbi:ester cyclase [Thalassococcus profundi]|uniref:ester cyclase n=1 Tax=Thalassococcus profundi TaxID=2282382 RepID=UPI0022784B0E